MKRFYAVKAILITAMLALWANSFADIVKNPDFTKLTVGYTECRPWIWQFGVPNTEEGSYDANGVYTFKGNGEAVYWCWDNFCMEAAFSVTVDKNFQFTARLVDAPDTGIKSNVGQIGIVVKATPESRMPVLSLRWDYYWDKLGDPNHNGLTFFNRVTPPQSIGYQDNGQKGLCQGTTCHPLCPAAPKTGEVAPCWEGCLNKGYENRVKPFTSKKNLWMRVKRVDNIFYLYARYDNQPWTMVQPVTNMGTDLADIYGGFTVPYTTNNLVFVGLGIAGGNYGGQTIQASFDNIELVTDTDVPVGNKDVVYPASMVQANSKDLHVRAFIEGNTLKLLGNRGLSTKAISQVSILRTDGKSLMTVNATGFGKQGVALTSKPAAGMYRALVTFADRTTISAPLFVQK